MENLTINSQIIHEFLPYLQQADTGQNLNEVFRVSLSIGVFMSRIVSLERAANLSGKTINEFVELLIDKNIVWQDYTDETHKLDKQAIKKYKALTKNY